MSKTFKSEQDEANEEQVARILGKAWKCEVGNFGLYDAIDWFFIRGGRTVAVAELKCRTHPSEKYRTVFLSLRKWLALTMVRVSTGLSAFFVVRFSDEIRYVEVGEIDARRLNISGRDPREGSSNDQEPIIEVPVSTMLVVRKRNGDNCDDDGVQGQRAREEA